MSKRSFRAASRVRVFSDEQRLNLVMGAPVTFITGKGGVGKTTLASLLTKAALAHGERVLFVSLFRDAYTNELLGITDADVEKDVFRSRTLGCDVSIVTPSVALRNYLTQKRMGVIAHRLDKTGLLDMVANLVPGMRELIVVGDIRSKAESLRWDRIIVDAPSTGHARSLFSIAESTNSIATNGVIKQQSSAALEFLRDKNSVQVVVATLDHAMPLSECREFVFELEDSLHMNIAAIVINKSRIADIKHSPSVEKNFADIFVPLFTYPHQDETRKRGVLSLRKKHKLPVGVADTVHINDDAKICIVLGSGGVGKTTTSAAIAVSLARQKKNVALLTIDPARRLGTALALDDTHSFESHLNEETLEISDEEESRLHIFQLDPSREFDQLLKTTMDQGSYDDTRHNTFVSAVTKMGIVNEFMAIEAMHRLVTSQKYDIVVIDTPPSHHVSDLFNAPAALQRMAQSQVYKTLVSAGTLASITANMALTTLMRPLKGLVGAELMSDAIEFLRSVKAVEEVFVQHSREVVNDLEKDTTYYVAVCNPSRISTEQASDLVRDMREREFHQCNVIVNGTNLDEDHEAIEKLSGRLKRFDSHVFVLEEMELDNPVEIVTALSENID